jgi:3-oxoacyl-[acyl-carrier-protein] synthase II
LDKSTNQRKRVVITGLGVITCLGQTIDSFWQDLLAGKSGIRRITSFDPDGFPCKIAGEIPEFDPTTYMPAKEARRMARNSQMALATALQAVEDADVVFRHSNWRHGTRRGGHQSAQL